MTYSRPAALFSLICLIVSPVFAQISGGTCSSANLKGTYSLILTGRGISATGSFTGGSQAVGSATFDGQSAVTFSGTVNTNQALGRAFSYTEPIQSPPIATARSLLQREVRLRSLWSCGVAGESSTSRARTPPMSIPAAEATFFRSFARRLRYPASSVTKPRDSRSPAARKVEPPKKLACFSSTDKAMSRLVPRSLPAGRHPPRLLPLERIQ